MSFDYTSKDNEDEFENAMRYEMMKTLKCFFYTTLKC